MRTTNKPCPSVMRTNVFVPSPKPSCALVTPKSTMVSSSVVFATPSAPSVFVCSKVKSPAKVCPTTCIDRFVPSTRTKGPAGSVNVTGTSPTLNDSETADVVLLIFTLSEPLSETPGRFKATVPRNEPAMPEFVISRKPLASVIEKTALAPSPKLRLTPVAATRMTFSPPVFVICSNTKSPSKVWPARVRRTPWPDTRT